MQSRDAAKWRAAELRELQQQRALGTWVLVPHPGKRARVIPCKWVYSIKRDGTYKARLVAKGCVQREGIDYEEVFAPTSRMTSLRLMLAVAAHRDLAIHQLDVESAFLNGELTEEVYVQQPPGHEQAGGWVCRLQKALYGLRQAPWAWHAKIRGILLAAGFEESAADPALFVRTTGSGEWILIHVDDLLLAASSEAELQATKAMLASHFKVKDMGPAADYLGMEVERDRESGLVVLSQRRYAHELLTKFGMAGAAPKSQPMTPGRQLVRAGTAGGPEQLPLEDASRYRELVGGLMYLANGTRPDLAFATGVLARFMAQPAQAHWDAAKDVLRYLVGTADMGLHYGGGGSAGAQPQLLGYADADFAGDKDTRRSTTGYVYLYNGGAVCWSSKLQDTVALSTVEAEYQAAARAAKEGLWLRKACADLGEPVSGALQCFGDNQGAISLIKNPVISDRSKHIDVMHHFVRERAARGEVVFSYCRTAEQVADALTKAVPLAKFTWCREGMGVY
jgi:hypothetical protein